MIASLAIANYRSLLKIAVPLGPLNIITGPNGSGKSNLYRALRLLAETANGGLVSALAREGGLPSTFWAGPQTLSARMRAGEVPVQGGPRTKRVRLRLGFASDTFGYAISLGLPPPSSATKFALDPEIKKEVIWAGPFFRQASALVERTGPVVRARSGRKWVVISQHMSAYDSIFSELSDPERAPEIIALRDHIRGWRFYDQFRTDAESALRAPQLGTRTPVLRHDGRDLAAALQTIIEIGDHELLHAAVADAFGGARLRINVGNDTRFAVQLEQDGLLRPLDSTEFSDGTLRYLLWVAALLSPRPPPLMVLNEPETSLHPDLLPALARLIVQASRTTQVWVVSHAPRLVNALEKDDACHSITLEKSLGETRIEGLGMLDEPAWYWPENE